MLRRSLAASAVHFWRPEKIENPGNPDFKKTKHLQNLGHFSLTAPGTTLDLYAVINFMNKGLYIVQKPDVRWD